MRSLFVFLLLIVVSNGLYAQKVVLKGKITDSRGLPVPFASVYEKKPQMELLQTAKVNIN